MATSTTWTRKKQETDGDHRFERRAVMTRAFELATTADERVRLFSLLRADVDTHDGLDYLQVFICDQDGRRVWCIDDGAYVTWLLPSDY